MNGITNIFGGLGKSSLGAMYDEKPLRVYAPYSLLAGLSSLEALGYALGIWS
jgi:hypothetical protein